MPCNSVKISEKEIKASDYLISELTMIAKHIKHDMAESPWCFTCMYTAALPKSSQQSAILPSAVKQLLTAYKCTSHYRSLILANKMTLV